MLDHHIPGSSKTKIIDKSSLSNENPMRHEIFPRSSDVSVMSAYEADGIVELLEAFSLEDIGSSEFMHMYAYQLERLLLQAHASARWAGSELNENEFVIESILKFEKIPTLVQMLLTVELWRTHLTQPSTSDQHVDETCTHSMVGYDESSLLSFVASHGNTLRLSFILHTETTLVCLLTLALFQRASCRDMDSDTAIALIDYCARQMILLAAPISTNEVVRRQKEPTCAQDVAKKMANRSKLDEARENILNVQFKTAVAATCMARYLCEHMDYLSVGAQTRILDTHDYLMLLIPLIDEPPWTRRRRVIKSQTDSDSSESIVWEKYTENNQWTEVPPSKLLHVTKFEAQCWISLFHLISSNSSRQQYAFTNFRRDQLLRLRKFLNDVTLDQIPVLTDVMQFMDQLAIMTAPNSATSAGCTLLLQEVDRVRESILRETNWDRILRHQIEEIFSKIQDVNDPDLRLISTIYDEESYVTIVEGTISSLDFLSEPLDIIYLRRFDDNSKAWIDIATFRSQQESSVIDTPIGPYRRSKLEANSLVDGPITVSLQDQVEAKIYFLSTGGSFSKTLRSNEPVTHLSSSTKKKWCQLGSLDEKIILQLCLIPQHSECTGLYEINQAFFSQPMR